MRVFFTGGLGKAGRHAVPYLRAQGHRVLDVDIAHPLQNGGDTLRGFFRGERPDIVAINLHRASARPVKPVEQAQKRGFASLTFSMT